MAGAATSKTVSKVYIRYFPFFSKKFEGNAKKILDCKTISSLTGINEHYFYKYVFKDSYKYAPFTLKNYPKQQRTSKAAIY